MKPKILFLILLIAVVAAAGGWWAAKNFSHGHDSDSGASGRKIRFYQCSMHPQVKADKPGKCPICGMDLAPIYEGQGALSEDLVTLDPNIIQVINVQVETAKKQPLRRTLRVAGTIEDDDTKHRFISAYIDGRIEKLFVNYTGAEVKKGQPLATFYSPNLLTAEREYLVVAQNQPTNATENIQQEHKRMLDSAAARLKRLGLTGTQIEALGKTNAATALHSQIVSPMSGTVVERFVYEGQYVKEGDKLFEIADFSTMWFQFDAYENDLAWLKLGQKIEVTSPSLPGKTYEGTINFINPNVSDPTRSAKVRVEIKNPLVERDGKKQRELLHRLYAEGIVKVDFPESLVVSRRAVLNPGGTPIVYVEQSEGSYELRKVKLGVFGEESWQVLEGLKEGERVVTSGNLLIDAQAQFNQGAMPGHEHGVASDAQEIDTANLAPLDEAQQKIANEFFGVASKMSLGLANDDVKQFNEHAAKLHTVLPTLAETFANDAQRKKIIEQIERAGHLPAAKDLASARKQFVPFTMATVDFARTVRSEPELKNVKIYKCPMANQGVPGAPKNGFWIQTEGTLLNPFFGDAMLTCGSEVQR